jgi:molecular chaperone GrpE
MDMKNDENGKAFARPVVTEELLKAEEAKPEEAPAQEPADESGAVSPQSPADLALAYQKLLAEKQELYDRLLRKQAEFDNWRKRTQREKEDFLAHAVADLVRALLPVLDGFDRALKHRDKRVPEQFYQGMELIHRELLEVLSRAGLAPVETGGQVFDPHFHQAVETVEVPGARDQEIVEELQRGYKLKHRLLRPATVKVAAAPRAEKARAPSGNAEADGS